METSSSESGGSARAGLGVTVIQPSLAAYRVPVFRSLASREGLRVRILYGSTGVIDNVEFDGFEASRIGLRRLPGGLFWQPSQINHRWVADADVIVFPWNTRYLSLPIAVSRARRRGQGVVMWGHGYSKRESGWRRWLRDRFGGMGDAVMFYNFGARDLAVSCGLPAERAFVALNSLDQEPIRRERLACASAPDRVRRLCVDHGLDPERTLLFVSRLHEDNGVDLLIRAVAALRERHAGLKAVVIGDGSMRGHLESLAEDLGVGGSVVFTGSIYGESSLAPWFCASTVFCYPKNIGLSILHAFGYGLPVVTSDRLESQNPEIEALVDGGNGVLYRDGEVDSLVDVLDGLLSDRALVERLGSGALETVTSRFTVERMVDGMEAAVRFAAASRGLPGAGGSAGS